MSDKLIYTSDDFIGKLNWSEIAQTKFDAWLKRQSVVFGNPSIGAKCWNQDPATHTTNSHRARLVYIEPIVLTECMHGPSPYQKEDMKWYCEWCGVEMEAKWIAKKSCTLLSSD